jgi:hypothetical protein
MHLRLCAAVNRKITVVKVRGINPSNNNAKNIGVPYNPQLNKVLSIDWTVILWSEGWLTPGIYSRYPKFSLMDLFRKCSRR